MISFDLITPCRSDILIRTHGILTNADGSVIHEETRTMTLAEYNEEVRIDARVEDFLFVMSEYEKMYNKKCPECMKKYNFKKKGLFEYFDLLKKMEFDYDIEMDLLHDTLSFECKH